MNISQIESAALMELWFKPRYEGAVIAKGTGQLRATKYPGEYNLIVNKQLTKVTLRDLKKQNTLDFHLQRGCAHLAEVLQEANDGSVIIKILFFSDNLIEMGEIEVGIDTKILEELTEEAERKRTPIRDFTELQRMLAERMSISVGSDKYFMILSGPVTDVDYKKTNADSGDENNEFYKETDQEIGNESVVEKKDRAFTIYGDELRFPVAKRSVTAVTEVFFVTKAIFSKKKDSEPALRLVKGNIKYIDLSNGPASHLSALAAGALNNLTKNSNSYLKQWDKYSEAEGDVLLGRARKIGALEYSHAENTGNDTVRFYFDTPIPEALSEGDQLEVTTEVPDYLKNNDTTWKDYEAAIAQGKSSQKKHASEAVSGSVVSMSIKDDGKDRDFIELAIPMVPKKKSVLILSTRGDEVQIRRRLEVKRKIVQGLTPNPLLGLLIEEDCMIPNIQRTTKIKPLSYFVKNKIFSSNPPTLRQIEAIDMALNTSGIVTIQGPPGTGKTTVITAIIERLNEEHDKSDTIRGQVLVSGFQHDAVENIVSRLSVNALPAVKFGRKSSDKKVEGNAIASQFSDWCKGVAGDIYLKNPNIGQRVEQQKLKELFIQYSLSPSSVNAKNMIDIILGLPAKDLSPELREKAKCILEDLDNEAMVFDQNSIRLVRSMRLTDSGFKDDGPVRAYDMLEGFRDILEVKDTKVLEKAVQWREGEPTPVASLRLIRDKLLARLIRKPQFRQEKHHKDILDLFMEVSSELEKSHNRANKLDSVLASFLHELENNPDGVLEAVEDYNYVYGATTQQALGKDIKKAKHRMYRSNDTETDRQMKYDTVIIDEAARTSPRDLLIPMSLAEKRIILVGDHRQLPHIIDENLAKACENAEGETDAFKESMFEYLIRRLKVLQNNDNIQRTITLNAQYRTHPLLGSFVSDNFYSMYGEGFSSPRKAEEFKHSLSSTQGKAALWMNIPNSMGKETVSPSRSRQRVVEAEAIAEQLNDWIDSEEGNGLSFGIISFYRAQVLAIYRALSKYGITESTENGWAVSHRYLVSGNKERLRIGTVDAFQGMEFDVVFLSMVRSRDMERLPGYIRNERDSKKKQQKIFGHLMSEQRLCVSMSRQKRVLIVVGDGDLIQTQIATEAVPQLANYYKLCQDHGEIL